VTGPEHFREAETAAQHAEGLVNAGDPEGLAPVWAAIGQVHATLALAAATAVGASGADSRAWADVAATKLSGGGTEPGPAPLG
jgi:hypothetical protein